MATNGCLNNLNVNGTLKGSFYTTVALSDITDGSTSTNLKLENSGAIITSLFDYTNSETAAFKCPDSCVVGWRIRIILAKNPTNNGVMEIYSNTSGSSQKFAMNSYLSLTLAEGSRCINETNIKLTLTGAGTNCIFGSGYIDLECVATNKILLTANLNMLGNGTGGTANFS